MVLVEIDSRFGAFAAVAIRAVLTEKRLNLLLPMVRSIGVIFSQANRWHCPA
jgi:hypothetical protein